MSTYKFIGINFYFKSNKFNQDIMTPEITIEISEKGRLLDIAHYSHDMTISSILRVDLKDYQEHMQSLGAIIFQGSSWFLNKEDCEKAKEYITSLGVMYNLRYN